MHSLAPRVSLKSYGKISFNFLHSFYNIITVICPHWKDKWDGIEKYVAHKNWISIIILSVLKKNTNKILQAPCCMSLYHMHSFLLNRMILSFFTWREFSCQPIGLSHLNIIKIASSALLWAYICLNNIHILKTNVYGLL